MTDAASIFNSNVPRPLPEARAATAFAPANIALAKYWGKRDRALNLPMNSSLSVSLGTRGTETQIAPAAEDTLSFNGSELATDTPAAAKVWQFVDWFCGQGRPPLSVNTANTIATAAGLASSASGFAALALALDAAFQTELPKATLSMLARFGSGSATRSLWQGFVRWDVGTAMDGTDSFASPISIDYPNFRIAIVTVDDGPKARSSTDGMTHTVETSPLYASWPARAEADCKLIEQALLARDFPTVGKLVEANALAMHATMIAARDPLCYLIPETWEKLHTLWNARGEGLQAYATMDAGPNVKIIFEEPDTSDIQQLFPHCQVINPFAVT